MSANIVNAIKAIKNEVGILSIKSAILSPMVSGSKTGSFRVFIFLKIKNYSQQINQTARYYHHSYCHTNCKIILSLGSVVFKWFCLLYCFSTSSSHFNGFSFKDIKVHVYLFNSLSIANAVGIRNGRYLLIMVLSLILMDLIFQSLFVT